MCPPVRIPIPSCREAPLTLLVDAYTFLFEPNPNWSHFYAPGAEIRQYIHHTVRKWNLDDHVQLNSRVLEAVWDEQAGKWKLKIEQNGTVKEDEAEIFVNGAGFAK